MPSFRVSSLCKLPMFGLWGWGFVCIASNSVQNRVRSNIPNSWKMTSELISLYSFALKGSIFTWIKSRATSNFSLQMASWETCDLQTYKHQFLTSKTVSLWLVKTCHPIVKRFRPSKVRILLVIRLVGLVTNRTSWWSKIRSVNKSGTVWRTVYWVICLVNKVLMWTRFLATLKVSWRDFWNATTFKREMSSSPGLSRCFSDSRRPTRL